MSVFAMTSECKMAKIPAHGQMGFGATRVRACVRACVRAATTSPAAVLAVDSVARSLHDPSVAAMRVTIPPCPK